MTLMSVYMSESQEQQEQWLPNVSCSLIEQPRSIKTY